jgi:hypothetical protein
MTKKDLIFSAVILGLCIALFASIKSCSSKQRDINEANQNIEALRDVTKKSVDALGRAVYERMVYIGDIETLKKLNSQLTKELIAQKGKTITGASTTIGVDTIFVDNYIYKTGDSTFSIKFNYEKNHDSLNSIAFKGTTPIRIRTKDSNLVLDSKQSTIEDFKLRIKIFTGIKEEDGKIKAYARTDFPGVYFDVEGAVKDPEKPFINDNKRFSLSIGPSIGYGISPSGQLGIIPALSLTVGLNIINF